MSYHSCITETPEPMIPASHSPQGSAGPAPPGLARWEHGLQSPLVSPALIPVKRVMVEEGQEITLKQNVTRKRGMKKVNSLTPTWDAMLGGKINWKAIHSLLRYLHLFKEALELCSCNTNTSTAGSKKDQPVGLPAPCHQWCKAQSDPHHVLWLLSPYPFPHNIIAKKVLHSHSSYYLKFIPKDSKALKRGLYREFLIVT